MNNIGQRTATSQSGSAFAAARSIDWGYDALGQVTKADSTIPGLSRAYSFDMIGNRISQSSGDLGSPISYTSNSLNQYTAVGAITPTYDLDGNATAYPLPANLSANSTLVWDGENRLISATVSGVTTNYRYDSGSRRIAKWRSGLQPLSFKLSIYDGWNPIAEYQGSVGVPPALSKTNLWGTDLSGTMQGAGGVGGLLLITDHSALATSYFPTFDGNGNVSEYLNSTGVVAAHYEYDPFGKTTVATGAKAADFTHRFSTKPLDSETGLYYYGYRFYDPATGRWPSRDPIGEKGGVILYGFVGNNGIGHIDYLGRLGVDLTNMSGFMHWLFGMGESLKVSWSSFDPIGAARNDLKEQWRLANVAKISEECDSMEWNTTKTTTITSPDLDVVYFSPIGWISGWHGKISGYSTGGSRNVDIWKTKEESKCECIAIADVRLRAEDTSDFNPGDMFIDGLGIEWRDDWFVWVRDNTPVGYDYTIFNWEDGSVEWKIEYN